MDDVKLVPLSFAPTLKLVQVKIDNYPDGHIGGTVTLSPNDTCVLLKIVF